MSDPEKKPVQTQNSDVINYVSLFLSVIALSLFVFSGLRITDQSEVDRKEVSTAYVWNYNSSTQV
jgi:uncharacterized protein with PQ loop repeat